MVTTLFGIPLPILGFLCFVLAAIFVYVWPKPASHVKRDMAVNMGLHYLHPLAWVLLGMAAFLQNRSLQTAIITAAVGGVVYLAFIVLLFTNKRK